MKIIKHTLFALVLLIGASACSTTLPHDISNAPLGDKTGRSSSMILFGTYPYQGNVMVGQNQSTLGIYFNGNYGVAEAVEDGGLSGGVAAIDVKTTYYFFSLLMKKEIIVAGK